MTNFFKCFYLWHGVRQLVLEWRQGGGGVLGVRRAHGRGVQAARGQQQETHRGVGRGVEGRRGGGEWCRKQTIVCLGGGGGGGESESLVRPLGETGRLHEDGGGARLRRSAVGWWWWCWTRRATGRGWNTAPTQAHTKQRTPSLISQLIVLLCKGFS